MEYSFLAQETADLAAQVEEKGAAFYRRLSAEVRDATVRDLCVFFAEQEDAHRQTFQKIARQFRGQTAEYSYSVDIGAMLRSSIGSVTSRHS
jgi:rubrerythrin